MPNTERIFFNISPLDLAKARYAIRAWRTEALAAGYPWGRSATEWPADEWIQITPELDLNLWTQYVRPTPGGPAHEVPQATLYPMRGDPHSPFGRETDTTSGSEVDVTAMLGDTSGYLWPRVARIVAQRMAHMGGSASLRHTYLFVENGRPRFYGQRQESGLPDEASFLRVARLLQRYQRYVHYCEEIEPEWKDVELLHFADNSTEMEQVDKRGRKRRLMVTAPHGDACF